MTARPITLIFILLVQIFTSCTRSTIEFQHGRIEDVFLEAKKKGKKVFVLIEDAGCGNCQMLLDAIQNSPETVNELKKNFLCYKANVQDLNQLPIIQITKCPAFPFPFFFDPEGKLLAFGFPPGKEFDVRNLTSFSVDLYRFRELFRLSISLEQYKELVSNNMQAYLAFTTAGGSRKKLDIALQLAAASQSIANYPFNLYLVDTLSRRLNKEKTNNTHVAISELTASDKLIYRNIINELQQIDTIASADKKELASYQVSPEKINLGRIKSGSVRTFNFEFNNTSNTPLTIENVNHPCTCIDVTWSKDVIPIHGKRVIQGTFRSNELGSFNRDIYVHVNSKDNSLRIVKLEGTVVD